MVVTRPGMVIVKVLVGVLVPMMEATMFAPAFEQAELVRQLVSPIYAVVELSVLRVVATVSVILVVGEGRSGRNCDGKDGQSENCFPDHH